MQKKTRSEHVLNGFLTLYIQKKRVAGVGGASAGVGVLTPSWHLTYWYVIVGKDLPQNALWVRQGKFLSPRLLTWKRLLSGVETYLMMDQYIFYFGFDWSAATFMDSGSWIRI